MLKIFTDTNYLTEKNRGIVFPLLFDLWYIKNKNIEDYYSLVDDFKLADIAVVPVDIAYFFKKNKTQWLYNFIDEGNRLNKKVWVYSAGDFGITLNKNIYTFRLGGFNSKLDKHTFILPAYTVDPYKLITNEFKTIPKDKLPQIGFVGNADGTWAKLAKEFLIYLKLNFKRIFKNYFSDYQEFYPSSLKRYQFLKALQKNNTVKTDFIFRKKYRAGAKTEQQRKLTSLEFFENVYNNPYTFCLRGSGNFSVRLYETLAMGRIPVVIDTDIRMPLGEVIDWEAHCVIVAEHDFMTKLIDFHKNINEKDFEQMQLNNRNLWLNYLNLEAYFIRIYSIFKEKII
ncbi:MAG: exostosin family protein [Gelidibacter sp.]|nr:exostosin family protein [Gelidibacter sp.]